MPPLLLDDEEAVAVALGLRCASAGSVAGIEEASLRALSKMEQLLPPRLARRIAALQTMIVTPAGGAAAVDAQLLSSIAAACRDTLTLRFRYRDHAGTATARLVEPHRLVNTGRRWYLVAWDTGREDWRTFRVDRIQPRPATGAAFAPARSAGAGPGGVCFQRRPGCAAVPCTREAAGIGRGGCRTAAVLRGRGGTGERSHLLLRPGGFHLRKPGVVPCPPRGGVRTAGTAGTHRTGAHAHIPAGPVDCARLMRGTPSANSNKRQEAEWKHIGANFWRRW